MVSAFHFCEAGEALGEAEAEEAGRVTANSKPAWSEKQVLD